MGILNGIALLHDLPAFQQFTVKLRLDIDHLLFPPQLGEKDCVVDRLRTADQRRTLPAEEIAFLRCLGGEIGEMTGLGKTARIHLHPQRLFHQLH